MRSFFAGLIALVLFVACVAADAQMWLEDREDKEGAGIKLSDSLVLHLGLGAEAGYDTNTFYEAGSKDPAVRLRFTPYVDLATRDGKRRVQDDGVLDATPPKIKFRLGVASSYDHHFALSDDSNVDQVNGKNAFGVSTNLKFELFPEGNFGLILDAAYMRTLTPYETAYDANNRHDIMPGIGFRIRPGGGTLTFETGYRLNFVIWEDPDMGSQNDKHTHDVRFHTSWKVFPKTALVSRFNFTPSVYYGSATINNNSLPIRSLFGIQGLVTDRFGLLLLAGYGASFYSAGPNFDSVLAQAELMFFITPFSNVRLGGQRDFVDSMYANYFVKNGGYLSYEHMFGGVFLATLKGEVFYRDYATNSGPFHPGVMSVSDAERSDVWASAALLLEFRITDWISVHASGSYLADITDFEYTVGDGDTSTPDTTYNAGFNKFEVFGGVRAHY